MIQNIKRLWKIQRCELFRKMPCCLGGWLCALSDFSKSGFIAQKHSEKKDKISHSRGRTLVLMHWQAFGPGAWSSLQDKLEVNRRTAWCVCLKATRLSVSYIRWHKGFCSPRTFVESSDGDERICKTKKAHNHRKVTKAVIWQKLNPGVLLQRRVSWSSQLDWFRSLENTENCQE